MKATNLFELKAPKRIRESTRYEGAPCWRGCGTTRFKRNHMCVVCRSTRRRPVDGSKRHIKDRIRLVNAYGITVEQREELFRKQGGRCAICDMPEEPTGHKLCIDHDHVLGKVRGLLCYNCNKALAFLGDTSKGVKRAYDYLRKNGA